MQNQFKWRAKPAFACYLALVGGILLGSILLELVLLGMRIDFPDLSFSPALITIPVNEIIIVGVTLLFARYKGASLKDLGLKKASFRILAIVSILAVPSYLLGLGVSIGEEIIFGPDPFGELISNLMIPRDSFQLTTMIILFLVLVGPCEELAFRGFIQKGFENSFGKMKGLLTASILFGLVHGLNTPYAIAPTFVAGLVLGYVWQKTERNTIASALMHGVNNSISIAIAYFLTI